MRWNGCGSGSMSPMHLVAGPISPDVKAYQAFAKSESCNSLSVAYISTYW